MVPIGSRKALNSRGGDLSDGEIRVNGDPCLFSHVKVPPKRWAIVLLPYPREAEVAVLMRPRKAERMVRVRPQ